MTYKVEEINNFSIVHLNGEIDMEVADKARQTILPLIENGKSVQVNLSKVDYKRFPLVKILLKQNNDNSLFETIIVTANDELVNNFLNKKIKFTDISEKLLNFVKLKEFKKYKMIKPKNIESVEKLNKYVRIKINKLSI